MSWRDSMRRKLEAIAEPWALRFIGPTFEGDTGAAFSLSCALGNAKRGDAAVLLWLAKAPVPAFRVFLQSVWEHDHRHVSAAAGKRVNLEAMFRYAAFSLPEDIPETVTVWRGTSALPRAQAVRGVSWTLDRDLACWFAMRFADRNGSPLLLTARVPRSEILLYTDERSEREAVIFRKRAKVCGTPEDWARGYAAVFAARTTPNTSTEASA
jgi:hypothetical protein